ncbi:MAG: zinc ribbon domain-containing protein, partial [Thermoplasmata archaeon]|nr:zinc ribbon domain-containing protein [Thermoplasmata archaeon]
MTGMDKCPVCGSDIGKDAEACGVCGTAFDAIPPKCPLCDTEVDEFVSECPNCGAEMEGNSEPVPDTSIDEVEIAEMPSEEEKETAELIATDVFVDVELEELVKLAGVGPLKAKILYDEGFKDLRKLKQASVV